MLFVGKQNQERSSFLALITFIPHYYLLKTRLKAPQLTAQHLLTVTFRQLVCADRVNIELKMDDEQTKAALLEKDVRKIGAQQLGILSFRSQ